MSDEAGATQQNLDHHPQIHLNIFLDDNTLTIRKTFDDILKVKVLDKNVLLLVPRSCCVLAGGGRSRGLCRHRLQGQSAPTKKLLPGCKIFRGDLLCRNWCGTTGPPPALSSSSPCPLTLSKACPPTCHHRAMAPHHRSTHHRRCRALLSPHPLVRVGVARTLVVARGGRRPPLPVVRGRPALVPCRTGASWSSAHRGCGARRFPIMKQHHFARRRPWET